MTILVTGATGTVGRHLVEQLVAGGHPVRALTRDASRAAFPAGVEVVTGDLSEPDSLGGVFDGVTAVHLITFTGSDFSPLTTGKEIVALAEEAGVRRATLLKGGLWGSPVEEALAGSSLHTVTLSPLEFMSNALGWKESILADGSVSEGFAEAQSAMVHEADIAAVAAAALTRADLTATELTVSGPQALTVGEQVAILAEAVGRDIRFDALTEEQVLAKWRSEGYGEEDITFFLQMRKDNPALGRTVVPTVEEVTGRPARTFAQWATENAAQFRS